MAIYRTGAVTPPVGVVKVCFTNTAAFLYGGICFGAAVGTLTGFVFGVVGTPSVATEEL